MNTNGGRPQFLRWALAAILVGAAVWSFMIAMSNWWAAQAPENPHHNDLLHYGNTFGVLSVVTLVAAIVVIWVLRRK